MTRNVRLGLVVLMIVAGALGCSRRPRYVTGEVGAGGEVIAFTPTTTTMVISGGAVDDGSVRAAIARALQARGYVIESDDAARMVARLSARRVTVRIALDYSPSQIAISHVDSQGLQIEDTFSSRRYDAWMRELTQTIESEIGRPAREAQEAIARAEEAQRQQEQAVRDAQQRELDRQSYERLEAERLAAERARAEADAERARAEAEQARALAITMPQMQGGVHLRIGRLRFDERRARRMRGAVALAAGFGPDPVAVQGQAGGPVSGAEMGFPAGCPGNFQGSAQHTIVLQTDMPYLRIEAPSSGDATLAIVTPDGEVWCDDDSAGSLVPRLHGMFPAGVYQVYVGNYQRGTVAYSLTLTQQPPGSVGSVIVTPPPMASCRSTLIELGHSSTSIMFCDGAEPRCADALLRAGHSPTSLQFCQGVDPDCAVQMLRSGRSPTELMHCR